MATQAASGHACELEAIPIYRLFHVRLRSSRVGLQADSKAAPLYTSTAAMRRTSH
ncbi:hypothetical protein BAUCODRAFT_39883 [Baudoinia panamericana UAMH 10762]|uniref:Uncharacterized protein n=1 Tax=Baudoinia panamericana (strain UAMH 10762) TaxID=717646 RepID=M2M2W7_BAUPA|nr:uncharacterized protein BAUCODRAFT_39883 [Baudoinia panamericana UAMH 10762]EMC90876.1 hypothetical protein BAUCODRAFT_39883 [Baudoinia panamericana UAMH 10762]